MSLEFYNLLKNPIPDNEKIIELAKKIDINETCGNIDLLTFCIFYQHKPAFHILLNRGININPTTYKDIPPLLWTLEVEDNYFLEQMLKKDNLNVFQITMKFKENLLSNSCLKLHDINLFHKIFNIMLERDTEKLNCLINQKTCIQSYDIVPLNICLHYLHQNCISGNYFPNIEKVTLDKIKIILNHTGKVSGCDIFNYLLNNTNLSVSNPNFVLSLIDYLQNFADFKDLLFKNKELIYDSIKKKCLPIFNLLLDNGVDINNNSENINNYSYLYYAAHMNNLVMVKKLIQKGINKEELKNSHHSLVEAIRHDNLEMVKTLNKFGYPLVCIYHSKMEVSNFSQTYKLIIPKYHRPLHIACAYGSQNVIKYIIDHTGDSLDYNGVCKFSPRDILEESLDKEIITDKHINLLISEEISYYEFKKRDKLKQSECCICLDSFHSEKICILECGHAFHSKCLTENMKTSETCPCCRAFAIVKNHCYCSLGKVIIKPNSLSKKSSRYLTNSIKKPKFYTTDEIEFLKILQDEELKEYEIAIKKEKKKIFLQKMEELEKPIRIQIMREYLKKRNIGMPKKRIFKPIYNSAQEENNPPNSPDLNRRKIKKKSPRNQGIDTNNIIFGTRRTRGVRPNYLIETI